MKDVRNEELVRLSLRQELTPEEESWLEGYFADHPPARARWEEERALNRAVASLPAVPVSSNFTSRVLQSIDLEQAAAKRERLGKPWLRTFLPRFTWATIAVLIAFIGTHEWRALNQSRMAHDLWLITRDVKRVPDPEILQDFEAINGLRATPATSDDELLVALQ